MENEYRTMSYQELVDKDWPDLEITDRTRQQCIEKGVRGDVRLSMGWFLTDEEWEKLRKKVLETPLP